MLATLATAAALTATALEAPVGPPVWAPQDAVLSFQVTRDGDDLGRHVLRFDRTAEGLDVTIDVDLAVKIGPLTPFLYRHDVVETWRDGELYALTSTTRKDRRDLKVDAKRSGDTLRVSGKYASLEAPADTVTTTWWNSDVLRRDALLNSETGELIPASAERVGEETVLVDGLAVEATRWRLTSSLTLDLWYDADGRWVKCAFDARGSQIEYTLSTEIASPS